jgi:hypothetical protein
MRRSRGLIAGALAYAAIVATPAAAASPRACTFPKGWYTAQAEYQYATYLFTGQAGDSVTQAAGALGAPQNSGALQAALTNLTTGNANRTATYAGATQEFAVRVVQATAQDPPRCGHRAR